MKSPPDARRAGSSVTMISAYQQCVGASRRCPPSVMLAEAQRLQRDARCANRMCDLPQGFDHSFRKIQKTFWNTSGAMGVITELRQIFCFCGSSVVVWQPWKERHEAVLVHHGCACEALLCHRWSIVLISLTLRDPPAAATNQSYLGGSHLISLFIAIAAAALTSSLSLTTVGSFVKPPGCRASVSDISRILPKLAVFARPIDRAANQPGIAQKTLCLWRHHLLVSIA